MVTMKSSLKKYHHRDGWAVPVPLVTSIVLQIRWFMKRIGGRYCETNIPQQITKSRWWYFLRDDFIVTIKTSYFPCMYSNIQAVPASHCELSVHVWQHSGSTCIPLWTFRVCIATFRQYLHPIVNFPCMYSNIQATVLWNKYSATDN
jgi:hypothetical protein